MSMEESEALGDAIPLSDSGSNLDTPVLADSGIPPSTIPLPEIPMMEEIALDESLSAPISADIIEPITDRETLDALRRLGERIDRKFADLQAAFDREVRAEASREKVIDRLHSELQDYKQDLLLNTLRPIFIDLIQLHDDIGKVAVVPADASADSSRYVELMLGFQEGIEDILYRQGVEPYRNDGDLFDPRRQRAVTTVATEDPALVKTIAARHRKGFQSGDRVIRPEIVSVHALKK
jgi:molecular chaperone GrpE